MTCRLIWNTLSLAEWDARFAKISRSSLLQSYDYGMAMRKFRGQTPRWAVIEIQGREAGLLQLLEIRILNGLIHLVILDRGPLWHGGYGTPEHWGLFLEAFHKEFPRRPGRFIRFIPETPAGAEIHNLLTEHGFKKRRSQPYQTLWLSLEKPEEEMFSALDKNWRTAVRKGEKSNLAVTWSGDADDVPLFLTHYHFDKKQRKYPGPPVSLLKAMTKYAIPRGHMLIGTARQNSETCAAVMLFLHGAGATYQAGWTTEQGRKTGAHNLLLWEAVKTLKAKGIKDFDLGGINEHSAKGVKKFKEGLGGAYIALPGIYH